LAVKEKTTTTARRPRGAAARRRSRKKRRYKTYYLLAFLLLVAVGIGLSLTVFFRIEYISAFGSTHYNEADITRLRALIKGTICFV
jgi:cell division septal protein FtsQ